MDAGFNIQVRAALRTQPPAVRRADRVDRNFQDKIFHQERRQVDNAALRDDKVRLFHDAVAEMIQFGQLDVEHLRIGLQAAAALGGDIGREVTGQQQALPRAREADETFEISQLKVVWQANVQFIKMDIPKGANRRV